MDIDMKRWYHRLDEEGKFRFDERCGIREFDGNMDRYEAEQVTYSELLMKPSK